MKIFLYDSLQRRKREFIPLDEKNVRIYACGPTVYNHAHIGNARMSVVTDLLVDVLKTNYSQVKFVSNITDIDDKIIEASRKSKIKIEEITKIFEYLQRGYVKYWSHIQIFNQKLLNI